MIDDKKAQRVKAFIEKFCCQKDGKPIKVLPWQYDRLILPLYGTVNDAGLRQYRQCFAFLPRRNGKSTLLGCLLIYELVCGEPAGECYVVSNTVVQSNDAVFDACLAIVSNSPELQKVLKVEKSRNRIINPKTRSKVAVLSSEKSALLGKNASFLCFDEIAFFSDRRIYSNLRGSQLNRREPLLIAITTASDNLEGVGKELYDYAVGVRDGRVKDESFLPVIFEASAEDDWKDPKTWRKANPSLGILFSEDELAKLCNEAKYQPTKESEFKQFHLNLWQHSAIAWISSEVWAACGEPFKVDSLDGLPCHVGIDLARRHDLAAYVLMFCQDETYFVLPRFFIPKDLVKTKEHQDKVSYGTWVKQGFIVATPGDVIDYAFIRESIKEDAKKYDIREIGYDPYGAELLCNQQLSQEDGFNVVEVRQSVLSMAQPTSQFEKLLLDKKLRHNNNPVLTWNAGNVVVREDHQKNISPDKKNSTSRIDGIVASIIALSRHLANPIPVGDMPFFAWA